MLATVTHTEGSTYTKAGAQMLIGPDGVSHGLLSGGCLEGDLAERGAAVRADGVARSVTYDMRNREHDEIWGLGLGCDGAIQVLLTRLDAGNDYAPFANIAAAIAGRQAAAWALVVDSTAAGVQAGATVTVNDGELAAHGLPPTLRQQLADHCMQVLGNDRPVSVKLADGTIDALVCPVFLPPRLLVAGAGPDVLPVLKFASELGWSVSVIDHRPAYLDRLASRGLEQAALVRPDALADALHLDAYDAALIMSHHLASDRDYLRALATARVPYVGLLGPTARRERLLADLGSAVGNLQQRLFAPVGLDIGAQGPAGIALAAVAQIHAVLKGRAGSHFHHSPGAAAKP